jgi:hypothetical protein
MDRLHTQLASRADKKIAIRCRQSDSLKGCLGVPESLNKLENFLPDVAEQLESAEKRNVRSVVRDTMDDLTNAAIKKINTLYRSDFGVFGYDMI